MDSITLLSNTHNYINRRKNIQSITLSVLMLLIGFVCFYFSIKEEIYSSSVSMLILTVGASLLLVGIFRLFWKSYSWYYTPTGSRVAIKSEFYEAADFYKLKSKLENSDFSGDKDIKSGNTGGIRMDYIYSNDRKFAAVQLYQFSSYIYRPATDIYYYHDMAADEFICCANKKMF